MNSSSVLARLLTLGLVVSAAACSSSASDEETDDGALTVEPNGTDSPGKLVVTAPTGSAQAATVTWSTKTVPVGTTFEPVPVGQQLVQVRSGGLLSQGRYAVEAGKTTTVNAGLLAIDAVSGPRTLGLNGVGTKQVQVGSPTGPLGTVPNLADGSKSEVLLATTLTLNFGVDAIDGISVPLGEAGKVKAVLSAYGTRRVTRITAPTRAMPTRTCNSSAPVPTNMLRFTAGSGQPSDYVEMSDGVTLDVGARTGISANYMVSALNWRQGLSLPLPAAAGPAPLAWNLGRIDVDDVLINSTLPRTPGTFRVFPARADGTATGQMMSSCDLPTKSGIDVPPGKYRVEVSYATVEAGTKVDVHIVDL